MWRGALQRTRNESAARSYLDCFKDTRPSCDNIFNDKTSISCFDVAFNQLLCTVALGFLPSYQHWFIMVGRNQLQHETVKPYVRIAADIHVDMADWWNRSMVKVNVDLYSALSWSQL